MKFSVVTYHLPHPDGSATGRQVFAVWDAIRELGHDVEAWCWGEAPAGLSAPDWVRCERYIDPGGWGRKPSRLRRPRGGLAEVGWQPPPDAVAWAEEPESYAAVDGATRTGTTVAHSAVLDAIALRRPELAVLQNARAERRAVRRADVAVGFSPRVARVTGIRDLCPYTLPIPAAPIPLVSEPTVVMIADWKWPPNQVALGRLLGSWSQVRAQVPEARLLLAGRGPLPDPHLDGVEVVGEVAQARSALQRAAVMAFPCPPTSGPKMKVIEALAQGVPVVTTPAGVEGLIGVDNAVAVAADADYVQTLVEVLQDPARRQAMAQEGRRAVLDNHSPAKAASTRLALVERLV